MAEQQPDASPHKSPRRQVPHSRGIVSPSLRGRAPAAAAHASPSAMSPVPVPVVAATVPPTSPKRQRGKSPSQLRAELQRARDEQRQFAAEAQQLRVQLLRGPSLPPSSPAPRSGPLPPPPPTFPPFTASPPRAAPPQSPRKTSPPRLPPPPADAFLSLARDREDERRWAITALSEREEALERVRGLEEQVQEEKKARADAEEQLRLQEARMQELREELGRARSERAADSDKSRERDAQIAAARMRVSDLERQIKTAEGFLAEKEQQKKHLEAERRALHDERQDLAQEVAEHKDQLSVSVSSFNVQNEAMRDRLQHLQADQTRLQGELASLRGDLTRAQSAASAAEREKNVALTKAEDAEQERETISRENAVLREQMAEQHSAVRESDRWRMEVERLRERLMSMPLTPEEYREERAADARRWEELQVRHEDELRRSDMVHARQCNDLVANVEEARVQRDAAVKDLKEAQMQVRRLSRRVQLQEEEAEHLEEEDGRRERGIAELRELREEIDSLRQDRASLRKELQTQQQLAGARETDMRAAFQDLRGAYEDSRRRNDTYRGRLRQATYDYRNAERSMLSPRSHPAPLSPASARRPPASPGVKSHPQRPELGSPSVGASRAVWGDSRRY